MDLDVKHNQPNGGWMKFGIVNLGQALYGTWVNTSVNLGQTLYGFRVTYFCLFLSLFFFFFVFLFFRVYSPEYGVRACATLRHPFILFFLNFRSLLSCFSSRHILGPRLGLCRINIRFVVSHPSLLCGGC